MRLEALGRKFHFEFRFGREIERELSWDKAIHLCRLVLRLKTALRGPAGCDTEPYGHTGLAETCADTSLLGWAVWCRDAGAASILISLPRRLGDRL